MIQGYTETNISAYISTEDNRIDTSVIATHIKFLVKFINDLDGSIVYGYANMPTGIKSRFTLIDFPYNLTPNIFQGKLKLFPSGHWKYEVYEVSWIGAVTLTSETAPISETDVLPVADTNGVVQGIVTKGILNLTERIGTEQVQYDQHETTEGTNTIYYGQ